MTVNEIASAAVREAVRIAVAAGNVVKEVSVDWTPRQVVFMAKPLAPEVRALIERAQLGLEPYDTAATPHDPADEGFVARTDQVVLTFPKAGEKRGW